MAGREPDYGPTAKTVAANVARLRKSQDLNYKQLSERVRVITDWNLSPVAIRRIEEGKRRVSPDDLMALAITLNCSPLVLLLPPARGDHYIQITGALQTGRDVWAWGQGKQPLIKVGHLETSWRGEQASVREAKLHEQWMLNTLEEYQGIAPGTPNVYYSPPPTDSGELPDGDEER
ncbi:helix-turn-helix domain-containing protein [Nocardia nova]|uniref:helix-turn-helix domain-containing protein n=1 Tax=Nocardia nova TaxID=37330 RepID=UPI001FE94AB9|nr:helix-turn-helix transcriptional regulator [Nocardia nova]